MRHGDDFPEPAEAKTSSGLKHGRGQKAVSSRKYHGLLKLC